MDKIKQLKEQRAALAAKNVDLSDKAASEKRDLTPEELQEFRDNTAKWEALGDQLRFLEAAEAAEKRNLENHVDTTLTEQHRAEIRKFITDAEQRTSIDGTTATVTVPKFVFERVITALKDKGDFLKAIEIIQTANGGDLVVGTYNNALTFVPVAEYNSATLQASSFSSVTLKSYTYTGAISISKTLINDSAFDLEKFMVEQLSDALYRTINSETTACSTDGHIRGILNDAYDSATVASSATSISYDDLVNLISKVVYPYSSRSAGKFMMNSNTFISLFKIKDSTGRPIIIQSVSADAPDTLFGYPVVINEDMPSIAPGSKPILFGDLSQYKLRIVNNVETTVLKEQFALYYAIGLVMNFRIDGRLIDAGTHPVTFLSMPE